MQINLLKISDRTSLDALSPRGVLGTIADLLAVLTVIGSAYVFITKDDIPRSVLAGTVCTLALVFIALSFRLHKLVLESHDRHRRQVQAVRSMPLLSSATAHVAKATVVAATDAVQFVLHLNNACADLAQMYSVATGRPCRVTVMNVYAPSAQRRPAGEAQQRHDLATKLLCASYAERTTRQGIDWIVDNTDFDAIFLEGAPHFMSNDLPAEVGKGYKNSHWDRAKIADFQAKDSWPYRATIVWPIASVPTGSPDTQIDLVGFVSVDSVEVDTFDKDFDVPTGDTFAHAMYSGMATYQAAQQRHTQRTRPEGSEQ